MENTSLFAKFIDNSFYCLTLVILSIIWCGYFTKNFFTQIVLGVIIGSLFYFFLFKLMKIPTNKKYLERSENKYKDNCILSLSLASPKKTCMFFEKMLQTEFFVSFERPFIKATNKTNGHSLFIYFNFYTKEFDHHHLYDVLDNPIHENTNLLIFAQQFSSECLLIAKNLKKVCLLNALDSYLLFKHFNTFPKISEKIKEKKFSNLKNNIFSSNNTKKFIKISLLLIFLSLFTPFKKYYLITASIVFIFAIICRFKNNNSLSKPTDFKKFLNTETN